MAMYPLGDIPVLQLSMPTHDPSRLMALGERLRPLREEGVLIIGSGFMTHGLPFVTREMFTEGKVPAWSSEFDAWVADALARGDIDELAAFRSRAPGMPYAIRPSSTTPRCSSRWAPRPTRTGRSRRRSTDT
jgi:4,5-DOPA dioxygenase extradiol